MPLMLELSIPGGGDFSAAAFSYWLYYILKNKPGRVIVYLSHK